MKPSEPGAPVFESAAQSRRDLLGAAAVATSACAACLAAWPLAASLCAVGSQSADAPWADVAAEAEVREGAPLKVVAHVSRRDGWSVTRADTDAVWLLRSGGAVRALSAACPHLGCAVVHDAQGFSCPCHGSRFGPDGAALSGPSPRSLDPLPVRLEGGRVLVQVVRFAPGTSARRQV